MELKYETKNSDDKNSDDKESEYISMRHNCGVLGYVSYSYKNIFINKLFKALDLLKHRGQDSTGISYITEENKISTVKRLGIPYNALRKEDVTIDKNFMGIGHLRYSTRKKTTEENKLKECQPFYFENSKSILGPFSVAHNGNIPHIKLIKDKFKIEVETESDSLILGYLIEILSLEFKSWREVFINFISEVSGVFCLMILTLDGIYAFKDRYGMRPLCIGKNKTIYGENIMIASESNPFKPTNFVYYRETNPGEIIFYSKKEKNLKSIYEYKIHLMKTKILNSNVSTCSSVSIKSLDLESDLELNDKEIDKYSMDIEECADIERFCSFELIYFFRHNSYFKCGNDLKTVSQIRGELGYQMADYEFNNHKDIISKIDYVLVIPDTPITSASYFADYLGLIYEEKFIQKSNLVDRTFILSTNKERKEACHKKFIFSEEAKEILKGKKIYLIDDSIVRGNVSQVVIEDLKKLGVEEIHMRIMSPPIRGNCYYGIDMTTEKELIATGRTTKEINDLLGCTSLEYLPINKMTDVFKRSLCLDCFEKNDLKHSFLQL